MIKLFMDDGIDLSINIFKISKYNVKYNKILYIFNHPLLLLN